MKSKYLECLTCSSRMTIQRKESKDRAAGHIKHMWCFTCKKLKPFVELDEFRSVRKEER